MGVPSGFFGQSSGIVNAIENVPLEPAEGRTGYVLDLPSGTVGGPRFTVDHSWLVTRAGDWARNYGDFAIFERVHIEPVYIDAGFVVSPQEHTIRAWNASRYQAIIAVEYEVEGDAGLSLIGAPLTPQHFPVLFQQAYTVFIDDAGPPQFENRLIIRFEDVFGTEIPDDLADAAFEGIRVVPFPIDPSGEIEEGYGYLTRILTSGNFNEQRAGLRRFPTRDWSFDFVLAGADSRLVQSLIHGWQHRAFGLPVWYDETVLGTTASVGGTTLVADTTLRRWGALAILWESPLVWEVIQVTSITDTQLNLGAVLLRTWPAGSKLYPVHLSRMDQQQPLEWRGLDLATMRARFIGEDWTEL